MERSVHADLKTVLLNNTPFVYAHLIKFERPSLLYNLSTTKPTTNKENFTYLTDASINVSFDDGSKNDDGGSNGAMVYRAQKILKVGNYSETLDAKATNLNLVVDSTAIDASVTATTISFSNSNTITTTGDEDFLSIGIREGDKITITGASNSGNNTSVNVTGFTNDNKTLSIEAADVDFTTLTTESAGQSVTIKVDSPEIQGPLFNSPSDQASPAYANRAVFIYKAFLNPDTFAIYGDPTLVFKGFIQSTQIKENPERESKVTWQLTSHWGDFNLVGGRSTNNASHRALNSKGVVQPAALIKPQYAYDLGFLHGDVALSTIAHYVTTETKQEMRSKKKGLFGLRKSYSLVDTEYQKANEVDLSIDIQSEKLPVIYGVQFAEPITVFADTNKVIAGGNTTIYRIDALCEGEVQGIYDIQIEEQPLICSSGPDFDERGVGGGANSETDIVCFGNATRGHTIGSKEYSGYIRSILIASGNAFGYSNDVAALQSEYTRAINNAYASIGQGPGDVAFYIGQQIAGDSRKQALQELAEPDAASGTVTSTTEGRGLYHKTYWPGVAGETSPNDMTVSFYHGSTHQEAHGPFVTRAKDEEFKRQTSFWADDKFTYWGPNHRLLDTAYAAIDCTINGDETQIPDIKYIVKGKKVECFNYDYSYEPGISNTQTNHAQFNFGDTVDIVHMDSNTAYVSSAMIIDKFSYYDDATVIYKFRFGNNLGEPINIANNLSGATEFRMRKGTEYWAMQTYDHNHQENAVVPSALAVDASGVSGSGTNSVVYTVSSTPSWLVNDLEIVLLPKTDGTGTNLMNNSTFRTEPIYVATVSGTNITLKNTANAGAFRQFHTLSGSDELPRIVAARKVQLSTGAEGTNDYYNNTKLILRRNTPSGIMSQERIITDYDGTSKIATISVPWDQSFLPRVYNYRVNPYKSVHDKYDIQNRLRDARVSNNPSMQLLDYLTGVYGKDLDLEDDIDLPTFQLAGRTCDTQSDLILTSTTAVNVTAGDVYQKYDGLNPANLVWQGQVKDSGSSVTEITFTNCIGKLNRVWDDFTSYNLGRIVCYKEGVYTTTGTGIVTNPPTGLSLISSFTLSKVGGGTLTMDASHKGLIEYTLYDADDVKYWRWYGWESRDQRYVTRHQLNTTVDTKKPVFNNVNAFLKQFNGILSYQAGKYTLMVETKTDPISSSVSGGYEQNARYITNEDILGSVNIKDAGPKKSYNSLEATIADPAIKWNDRQISFYDSDYLKQDRGIKKEGRIVVSAVTNYHNARISIENYLRKSRFGLSVNFTVGPKGLLLLAGDTIKLTYDRFNWSEKVFRITNLQFKEDCTVQVSAHEYHDSMYTITGPTELDIENLQNSTTHNPSLVAPTFTGASGTGAQTVTNGIKLTWARPSGVSVGTVTEIWMRVGSNQRSGATLIHTTGGAETSYFFNETIETGNHYFWVRHKKPMVGSQGIARNVITAKYSDFSPTSATGGIVGAVTLQSSGTNSKSVKLTPNKHVLVYNQDGGENPDTTFTFTTSVQNMGTNASNTYYEFKVNGGNPTGGAVNGNTTTFTLPDADEPAIGGTTTVSVSVRENSASGTVVATDTVTLYAVQDGDDAVTGFITNQAHTVDATAAGTVSSLSGAGGNARAFVGSAEVTSSCGFSIVNATSGLSMSIDGNGAYTVTELTAVSATATIRISVPHTLVQGSNALEIDLTYSISKSKAGSNGISAHVTSTDYSIVYDSQGANPSFTAGAVSGKVRITGSAFGFEQPRYKFYLAGSTVQDWSQTAFYDYTIPAAFSNFGIPKVFKLEVREGDSGNADADDSISVFALQTGSSGDSIREITIYRKYSFTGTWTTPAAPTGGSYNFSNQTLTPPTSWSATLPSYNPKNELVYCSKGIAQAQPQGTDSSISWTTPILESLSDTVDFVFRRSATNPGTPATTIAGTNPSGWYTNISNVPSSDNPMWVSQGSAGGITVNESGGSSTSSMLVAYEPATQLEGQDAPVGFLTNPSHTVATAEDGTGYNLTNAGGTFERFKGGTDLTGSNTTYAMGTSGTAVSATQNGLTFTINQSTGVYTLSGGSWTSNEEVFTVRAIANSNTITQKYTIAKSLGGTAAYDIDTDNLAVVFKASAAGAVSSYSGSEMVIKVSKKGSPLSATSGTPGAGQFKVTASGTGITVDNSPTVSGNSYSYGVASGMANNTDTAKITFTINCENEVSISRVQNFSKSQTGDNGIKTAHPNVWYTSSSSSNPGTPTATNYTFATRVYTGLSSGWSTTRPTIAAASANNWWVSQVTATENSADAGISSGSNLVFETPVKRFDGMGNVIDKDVADWAIDFVGINPRISIGGSSISTATTPVGVRNPPFTTGTSFPGSPENGEVFYHTGTKRLYKYKE